MESTGSFAGPHLPRTAAYLIIRPSAAASCPLRFWSFIDFGTKRYPERVARRLRVVNLICWASALPLYLIAARRFSDPATLRWGFEATAVATMFMCIPLLHRFNSAAALVALIVLAYIDTWRISLDGGTGGGYWLAYIAGSALGILILGAERPFLSTLLAIVSTVTAIAMHLYVPAQTGDQSADDQFTSLLINIGRTQILMFLVVFFGARQIAHAEDIAEAERDRSDALLANILPASIADRLKHSPKERIADRYESASVLFADMAGFTAMAGGVEPEVLVRFLDSVFSTFDTLTERHGLEKIKTSGDAYMVVSGIPSPRAHHAQALVQLALAMIDEARHFEHRIDIRIGIASGPVVAGVVGQTKFFYDVWGDTVNVAARMEQTGIPGRIQISLETARLLDGATPLEPRGPVSVKGKGEIETYFVAEFEAL